LSLSINYDSPQNIREFLKNRGLGARKRYGQNFLINPGARNTLLDALDAPPGALVWEVGPGLGAMTAGLLSRGARVCAFEIDRGFSAVLAEFFGAEPGFRLVEGDVLRTWPGTERARYFLGNLPYHIAGALLGEFIEKRCFFDRMVVTVQREVARRMCAPPGTADYSSLSVLCASAYRLTPLSVFKGAAFYPPPRVESQGVRLDLLPEAPRYPPGFARLVRGLFAARRKTVKNNWAALGGSLEALERCGIDPRERAENLPLGAFAALARFFH